MYKQIKPSKTTLTKLYKVVQGETIEMKCRRIQENKEPIKDGAPRIYTERKDGVMPQYDIRTDKWEMLAEMADTASKAHLAKREENHKEISKTEPAQATEPGTASQGG